LYDGTAGAKAIDKVLQDATAKGGAKNMMLDRRERAITALPSPDVYFGYMFNFTTALAGPAFEISEYVKAQARPAAPPGRFLPALVTLGYGILFMVGNVVAGIYGFTVDGIYAQVCPYAAPFFHSDSCHVKRATFVCRVLQAIAEPPADLLQRAINILSRIAYAHIALMSVRFSYYGVWKISEAARYRGKSVSLTRAFP
jgi:hypothetical protein